jgi:GNAT superfamily N-acetyltransferase
MSAGDTTLRVRPAGPQDAPGIVAVHQSGVSQWFRYRSDGTRIPARLEDLGPADRYRNGGPFMAIECALPHLRRLLSSGQLAFVAETDTEEIVGELELYIGRESDWGRTAHIDMLEVHPHYRRRGAGKALVAAAMDLGKERRTDRLSTNAEKTAIRFYQRCGLEETLARVRGGSVATDAVPPGRENTVAPGKIETYRPLEHRRMILGRLQSSFAEWIKRREPIPGITDQLKSEEGWVEELDAYYRIEESVLEPGVAWLQSWTSVPGRVREILLALINRARELGFVRVRTVVDRNALQALAGLPIVWGEEYIFLGRRLR